ncbi:hypothetical protein K7B10_01935 [Streptomyces flavotricini]|uniref:Uncharacterized protein n=1 Tax=Streptomyces flavotricini TaxID=66888 RepID=A0ABS8DXL7_9ACTN|nr:hypothetical protein [Streptomyces flavotricini]MCC0093573.1 hypothetical protein [Streptomyces flavotricini]
MREILTANGAGSELRLLLQDRHGVWGALGLLRCAGACPFGPDDLQRRPGSDRRSSPPCAAT